MNNEINPIEEDFNAALSRYKAGKDLIPIAQDFQKNHTANSKSFCCLDLLIMASITFEK